jgi:hypothetical protein
MAKKVIVDDIELAARLGNTTTLAQLLAKFDRTLVERAHPDNDLGAVQPAEGVDDSTAMDVLCRLASGKIIKIDPAIDEAVQELASSYHGAYGSHIHGHYSMDMQGRLLFPQELAETAMRRQKKQNFNDASFYCYLITEKGESPYIHLRDNPLNTISNDVLAYDRTISIGNKRRIIIPSSFRKSQKNPNGIFETGQEACYLGSDDHIRIYNLAHMEGIPQTTE